jgi:hypothetical protein
MAEEQISDDQQPAVIPDEVGEPTDPFFSYQYLDGDKKDFSTRDDLTQGFRKSYLRTKEMERDRAKWDGEKAESTKQLEALQKEREHERAISRQYLEWDQRLQSDPNVYAQVKAYLDGGNVNGQKVAPEPDRKLLEKIESLEKRLNEGDESKRVDGAWKGFGEKNPKHDRAAIEELLSVVQDGDEEKLLEVLHQASRGYSLNGTDVDVEKTVAWEKDAGDLSPTRTAVKSTKPAFNSVQEAADQAYKDAGIGI